MNRQERMKWAEQTVAICDQGSYVAASGKKVEVSSLLKNSADGTVVYSPENPPRTETASAFKTAIEVHNQTTFEAIVDLDRNGHDRIGCLNFASAKNPGGGFLTGAQAQEEALARSSGLYSCLLKAPEYYERNRSNRSTIYLDMIIYSPSVPFFRDDRGTLLEKPIFASVITAPAPNAGAVTQNEPHNIPAIEPALRRRADLVLEVAHAHKVDSLILGAWGCGVFRNDPRAVAKIFAELLGPNGKFTGVFKKVVFAVYDRTDGQQTYQSFQNEFAHD
jgi:uncharacterized protein (TIGR02452 family)